MQNAENQSAEQQKSTEQRIMLEAEREFLDKGFSGARTTAIAERAGVTHAMLHYYFRTKEKLFQQILTHKISRLKGMMLSPLLNCDLPLFEKIKFVIETHLDFLAENPDLPRFVLTIMHGNPEWQEYFREYAAESGADVVSTLQSEIDFNAAKGICRRVDASMLLLNIVALNAFPFIGAPLVNGLLGDFCLAPDFIQERKENNVELILNNLKP